MRFIYFSVLFIALFLLSSCETEIMLSQGDVLIHQPVISYEQSETSSLWILNNLELDRIVQIETTENYLMSNHIARAISYDDILIILDKDANSVFVVNACTGKVQTQINRRGRGPGEYRSIIDIAFDDKNEQILVYNDYQKLFFFSLDGQFLKEEKINNDLYSSILYNNDHVIFHNKGIGISCYPYSIDVFNLTDMTWKTIGTNQKVNFNVSLSGPLLVKSKNIWYAPSLDMGLHLLDGDTIRVPFGLEVVNRLPKDLQKKSDRDFSSFSREVRERNILYMIQSIRETENFLAFYSNSGFMMFDKNTLQIRGAKWLNDKILGVKMTFTQYIAHDGDDNKIMFKISHDQWLERKPTNTNVPEHLKEQIEAVKIDEKLESNPILVFYKEKKHE